MQGCRDSGNYLFSIQTYEVFKLKHVQYFENEYDALK